MRKIGLTLFLLYLVSLASFAWLKWPVHEGLHPARELGELFGNAAAPVIAAMLIAVPWAIINRIFRVQSNGPIGAAVFICLLVLIFAFKGMDIHRLRDTSLLTHEATGTASSVALPTTFSNCEFSIVFPYAPSIVKKSAYVSQQLIEFEEASLATDSEYLRADCFPLAINATAATNTLMKQVEQDGLQGPVYEQTTPTLVQVRAYKNVAGRPATVSVSIHIGSRSTLTAYVGAESAVFPTLAISNFTNSVGKQ